MISTVQNTDSSVPFPYECPRLGGSRSICIAWGRSLGSLLRLVICSKGLRRRRRISTSGRCQGGRIGPSCWFLGLAREVGVGGVVGRVHAGSLWGGRGVLMLVWVLWRCWDAALTNICVAVCVVISWISRENEGKWASRWCEKITFVLFFHSRLFSSFCLSLTFFSDPNITRRRRRRSMNLPQ